MIPEGYLLTTRFLRYVSADDEQSSCVPSPHVHREHAVFWAARGVASDLEVDGVQRSLAPGQGLFVPPGTPHGASRAETTALAVLFVHPHAWPQAPDQVASVVANAALREMLIHLAQFAMPRDQRLRAQHVCLELITEEPRVSLALSVPRDPRIVGIARAILSDPADGRSLEDWAYLTSSSTRTLVRAFRAETGMTFAEWRSCARMSAAVALLGDGFPVGVVARRVGYATASAFSAAFHRTMGRPPHRFLPTRGADAWQTDV
ncbi:MULTISPECIES: helix-turn-helix transcriptional regulator [Brachybacterium]|uniref:helix-turn-helix transcriptional regulator n=1 Tax=Brachybacterium TaxID=43668 RepID=UPI001867C4F9|nr:AraC family transcriptional regulator [Brachybacterium tyrofermentans]